MRKHEYFWILIFLTNSIVVLGQKIPDLNDPTKHPKQVISNVPNSIEGKPLTYWLNHPKIDFYSKLYIQGKFSVSDNDLTFQILDSINSKNIETIPFYLFVFHKIMNKSDGALSEAVSWTCAKYIKQNPCSFFSNIKYGQYKSYYRSWEDYSTYSGLWDANNREQVKSEIESKMKLNCATKFEVDWTQLLNKIETG